MLALQIVARQAGDRVRRPADWPRIDVAGKGLRVPSIYHNLRWHVCGLGQVGQMLSSDLVDGCGIKARGSHDKPQQFGGRPEARRQRFETPVDCVPSGRGRKPSTEPQEPLLEGCGWQIASAL